VAEGNKYVIDLDLEKFFDKVNHDRLMWMLGTRIRDKRVVSLVGKFLLDLEFSGSENKEGTV
jgi:RNA-directed DNA polymerase